MESVHYESVLLYSTGPMCNLIKLLLSAIY